METAMLIKCVNVNGVHVMDTASNTSTRLGYILPQSVCSVVEKQTIDLMVWYNINYLSTTAWVEGGLNGSNWVTLEEDGTVSRIDKIISNEPIIPNDDDKPIIADPLIVQHEHINPKSPIDTPEYIIHKNKANGYPGLDENGKIAKSQIPVDQAGETTIAFNANGFVLTEKGVPSTWIIEKNNDGKVSKVSCGDDIVNITY